MSAFTDHLSRLGFRLERRAEGAWLATRDDHPPALLVEGASGLLLRASFVALGLRSEEPLLEVVNRLNREAAVARFFVLDETLVVEAWHSRAYSEEGFDAFLLVWGRDLGLLLDEYRSAPGRGTG